MKKTRESLNRPGTARYPKGKERVEKILNAAKNVLVKEGYGGLTMRNVALGAGTTVGNLQYYYADKDRLLHDMLEYMVTGFFEDFSAILQDPKRMAEEKLVAYIDCIFDAFSVEDKGKFYPGTLGLVEPQSGGGQTDGRNVRDGFLLLERHHPADQPQTERA